MTGVDVLAGSPKFTVNNGWCTPVGCVLCGVLRDACGPAGAPTTAGADGAASESVTVVMTVKVVCVWDVVTGSSSAVMVEAVSAASTSDCGDVSRSRRVTVAVGSAPVGARMDGCSVALVGERGWMKLSSASLSAFRVEITASGNCARMSNPSATSCSFVGTNCLSGAKPVPSRVAEVACACCTSSKGSVDGSASLGTAATRFNAWCTKGTLTDGGGCDSSPHALSSLCSCSAVGGSPTSSFIMRAYFCRLKRYIGTTSTIRISHLDLSWASRSPCCRQLNASVCKCSVFPAKSM